MWVRKYARPRGADGRFLAGRQLWTREDGQTRWIRFLEPDGSERERFGFTYDDTALRHLLVLVFVVIVAGLMAAFLR